MSVNRDPKVGDRFLWDGGHDFVKVVTGADGDRLRYRLEGGLVEHRCLIKHWHSAAILVDPSMTAPPLDRRRQMNDAVAVARYVADYWRQHLMSMANDTTSAVGYQTGAHALCMVLAALDGETRPEHLGVGPDGADQINAITEIAEGVVRLIAGITEARRDR